MTKDDVKQVLQSIGIDTDDGKIKNIEIVIEE